MMICPGNLSKHLKICYQTKTIRKMFEHDFQFFFANLMTFFSWKKKWSNISFSYYFFSHLCKISNKKKTDYDMCIWIFSITLSHFERITWIFVYDKCQNHFWKKMVSYLVLWIMNWWQSHLGPDAHLRRWQRKTKCQKMNVNFLQLN